MSQHQRKEPAVIDSTTVATPTGETAILFSFGTKNGDNVSNHRIFVHMEKGLNAMAAVSYLADILGAKLLKAGIAWDEVVSFSAEHIPQIFQLATPLAQVSADEQLMRGIYGELPAPIEGNEK
jgi:hypothetical protein